MAEIIYVAQRQNSPELDVDCMYVSTYYFHNYYVNLSGTTVADMYIPKV